MRNYTTTDLVDPEAYYSKLLKQDAEKLQEEYFEEQNTHGRAKEVTLGRLKKLQDANSHLKYFANAVGYSSCDAAAKDGYRRKAGGFKHDEKALSSIDEILSEYGDAVLAINSGWIYVYG